MAQVVQADWRRIRVEILFLSHPNCPIKCVVFLALTFPPSFPQIKIFMCKWCQKKIQGFT